LPSSMACLCFSIRAEAPKPLKSLRTACGCMRLAGWSWVNCDQAIWSDSTLSQRLRRSDSFIN
jgi:hypothetical protein